MKQTYKFVNPYNFMPLSGNRSTWKEQKEKRYTGVIEYEVLTKTPLFIPNTSNSDAFQKGVEGHKSYDFFSYTDLSDKKESVKDHPEIPVIPGSEMRGMLRGNFEILTNSCMSAIDDDVVLGKRTNEVYKAGLLKRNEDGTFDLHKAIDCLMRTKKENSLIDDWADDPEHYRRKCYIQDGLKEGQKVYFKYIKRDRGKPLAKQVSTQHLENRREGYVLKGEDGPDMEGKKQQKHCCHVFTPNFSETATKAIAVEPLEQVLREYRNNGEHLYSEYYNEWKKFKAGNGELYFPVYYSSAIKGYIMLSPACITREIYRNKISNLVGSYASCKDKNKLCPACALFGTIGLGFTKASRIRVADLVCVDSRSAKELYEKPITLPALSSPKINNMEFYLKRPKDAWFWTYDYFIDKKGQIHMIQPELNGRKFYWHNLKAKLVSDVPSKLNMTVRPLKKGVHFCGKLYFNNLLKEELDQLIYLLNVGEEESIEKKQHGYKLGGVKPYGFGSIAVSVNRVLLRDVKKNDVLRTVEHRLDVAYEEYKVPEFDKEIVNNFEKMTNFYILDGMNVSYPMTGIPNKEGKMNIFDWFTKNHTAYKYNKEQKKRVWNKMPNTRCQMTYAEYMKAMEPQLQSTGFREEIKEKRF